MWSRKRILGVISIVVIGSFLLMGVIAGSVMGDDAKFDNTPVSVVKNPGIRADVGKTVAIEPPTKAIVAAKSATVIESQNPKVMPGKVKWHSNFSDACAASKKSGKPVLLFQMMGKLDNQFC
ncbi:MAG: hypothetical protein ACJ8FY_10345 [Gemmataceae bacterium]